METVEKQPTQYYNPLTPENAPELSGKILEQTKSSLGFVPNMYANMANNPSLLDAYSKAYETFRANSGFSPVEQEVILLSVAYENGCDYCVAAHSFIADNKSKVPEEVTDAIRNGGEVPDKKLGTLSKFTKAMTSKRGWVSEDEVNEFLEAGYTKEHIFGVITGIGVKTFSNYSNHIANTPLDDAFQGRAWKKD